MDWSGSGVASGRRRTLRRRARNVRRTPCPAGWWRGGAARLDGRDTGAGRGNDMAGGGRRRGGCAARRAGRGGAAGPGNRPSRAYRRVGTDRGRVRAGSAGRGDRDDGAAVGGRRPAADRGGRVGVDTGGGRGGVAVDAGAGGSHRPGHGDRDALAHRDAALVVARCEYNPTPECPTTSITGVPGAGPETTSSNKLLDDAQSELLAAFDDRRSGIPGADAAVDCRDRRPLRGAGRCGGERRHRAGVALGRDELIHALESVRVCAARADRRRVRVPRVAAVVAAALAGRNGTGSPDRRGHRARQGAKRGGAAADRARDRRRDRSRGDRRKHRREGGWLGTVEGIGVRSRSPTAPPRCPGRCRR